VVQDLSEIVKLREYLGNNDLPMRIIQIDQSGTSLLVIGKNSKKIRTNADKKRKIEEVRSALESYRGDADVARRHLP